MGIEFTDALIALVSLAALTGLVHTLAGPDHYLPFIVMSRARKWSAGRTAWITFLCGLGHVAGSVILGGLGVAAGLAIANIESVESMRGDVAAWLMIAFGAVYMAWGFWKIRRRPHAHAHQHDDEVHIHTHDHAPGSRHTIEHSHDHETRTPARSITPWVLFTIFAFGPCEVLIPLLMYPAAQESVQGLILVTAVFAATTIGTMLVMVMSLSFGLRAVKLGWLERHTHAVAGFTIACCGALILLGL